MLWLRVVVGYFVFLVSAVYPAKNEAVHAADFAEPFGSKYIPFEPTYVENLGSMYFTKSRYWKASNSRSLRAHADVTENVEKPRLHRCRDAGEAYGAAYLITKEHMFEQFTDYNLTWVNCEMGSFIFMNGRANPMKDVNGSIMQSIDVLDFSVIHLSTYERLLKRWKYSIKSNDANTGNIDPVKKSAELLRQRAIGANKLTEVVGPRYDKFNRTIVIMPFLGTDMGAGHSKLSNRYQYLAACFWSFYADYKHIVVAVKSEKDRFFAR
jgi:hypothetical protein